MKTPMYYFCEKAKVQFLTSDEYALLSEEDKKKYRPATFEDVKLHGSEEIKKKIEQYNIEQKNKQTNDKLKNDTSTKPVKKSSSK